MNEALPARLLSPERVPVLIQFEKRLGYRFHNRLWLEQAFAHSSYVNEQRDATWRDNEKLEFLGDAVLELTISMLLYRTFPQYFEGDLTKLRAAVVSTPTLSQIAKRLHIGDCLLLGKGEDRAGGRQRASLLADALEAVLGAVYMDSPRWWAPAHRLAPVRRVVRTHFAPEIERLDQVQHKMDFKSMLQERTQSRFKTLPKYVILREEGPPHDKTYEVAIKIEDEVFGRGRGRSKKQAEQAAAREALVRLGALAEGAEQAQTRP